MRQDRGYAHLFRMPRAGAAHIFRSFEIVLSNSQRVCETLLRPCCVCASYHLEYHIYRLENPLWTTENTGTEFLREQSF